jgi:hypothetical protein
MLPTPYFVSFKPRRLPTRKVMTVCIAAACKENKESRLILCSDRKIGTWMASAQLGAKFRWAGRNWPALVSGTMTRAEELLATYRQSLSGVKVDTSNMFDEFKKPALLHKEKRADEYVKNKFGFSYEHLRKNGKKELPASLLYESFSEIKNMELDCDLLIAGFVEDDARIFLVQGNGTVSYHDHFATIGTGGPISEAALYQRQQQKLLGLNSSIYHVYEAKKLAEIAEGVGTDTVLIVLSPPKDEEAEVGFRAVTTKGFVELQTKYTEFGLKKNVSGIDSAKILEQIGGE